MMPRKIIAVVNDLMFTVKILDAGKRAGLTVVFVKSAEDAVAQAEEAVAVILDLNFAPLDLIAQLKTAEATRKVPVIGYASHVQAEVIRLAKEKGCDKVLARSGFVQQLGPMMEALARS
jgi:CheY-like chemotaxis protein